MNNIDLFNFKFVDRSREKTIIENFLHGNKPEILWVLGNSGVGKSFFLQNTLFKKSKGRVIYIDINKKNATSNCVSLLISELENISQLSFIEFVKKNYTKIIDFSKSFNKTISICTGFGYGELIELLLNESKLFVSTNMHQENAVHVLSKYINLILTKTNLTIAIDNFTYCDIGSIDIILDFIQMYINNDKIRFILSTTTSEIEKNYILKKEIISRIAYTPLEITPFDSQSYFMEILSYVIDLKNITESQIQQIYNYCEGVPENLQILLANLCFKNGIIHTSGLPAFDLNVLSGELLSTKKRIDISSIGLYPKILLLIIVCTNVPLTLSLLFDLVNYYIFNTMHFGILSTDKFSDMISDQENKTIEIKLEDSIAKVYIKHDLLIQGLFDDFKKENLVELTSKLIYEFLVLNKQRFINSGITVDAYEALLAYHSYIAKLSQWIELNYNYGNKKLEAANYKVAYDILARLHDIRSSLSVSQRITLAKCYYENGYYQDSNKVFFELRDENIEQNNLYDYHFYYGKTLNMCAQKDLAISHFRKAIAYSSDNTDKQIDAYNLLHLVLIETPGGRKESENIFKKLTCNLNETNMYKISIAKLLKGCGNFYSGEEALEKFSNALKIAQKFDNQLEIAYILNNMGFEYIRENKFGLAINKFNSAIDIIEKIKKHESSYTKNNIAICYMFQNKFDNAISTLQNALFITRSYYAKLTIQIHLMHAYRLNGDIKECRNYINAILNSMHEYLFNDPTLLRKVHINLALNYWILDETINAKYHLDKVFDMCLGTSSEYRACMLKYELSNHTYVIPSRIQHVTSNYLTNMNFEPWCITFSHE